MSETESTESSGAGTEHTELEAEKKNGVYLLSVHTEYEGYSVKSATDRSLVQNVTVNGNYIAPSDYFETECDDFEITEDRTLNLRYLQMDTER
jgi:hypothetical protein